MLVTGEFSLGVLSCMVTAAVIHATKHRVAHAACIVLVWCAVPRLLLDIPILVPSRNIFVPSVPSGEPFGIVTVFIVVVAVVVVAFRHLLFFDLLLLSQEILYSSLS